MPITAATRRLLLLIILAVVIGFAAGGAAYLLVRAIGLITSIAFFGRFEWGEIPSLANLEPSPRLPIVAIIGAFIVSLMAMWAPVIRGHGIPETMEAVLRRQSRIQPRAAIAKPLSTAIAVGTGAPFGAEGPIIVTGGAIGSLVGQFIKVSPSERKILLASGAAAGMAATFGSPLASVLLAIELLLFELSMRSLIPLVMSTSIASGIHTVLIEEGPLFDVPEHGFAGFTSLPLFAVLGLCCGLLAVLIANGLFRSEKLFRELPIPIFWHPMIGAIGFSAIGLIEPRALGVGTDVIEGVFNREFSIGMLAGILVAKTLAWWIALASGTSGGTLAPVLLMSATFGGLFAAVSALLFPSIGESGTAFAVVAMAATFGAVARAPFTAIVFVFELTRDFEIMPPLMLASVLAALVFTTLSSESLYTERLSRRGIRVGAELKADAFRTTAVADVMNRAVDSLPITATVGEAAEGIIRRGRGAYPLVDEEHRCVGIVSRSDLLAEDFDPDALLIDVINSEVVTISPDASLADALHLMVDEDVNHLPVVENNELVGICTRADILGASGSEELALERMEAGWLAPVLQRRTKPTRRYVIVANETLAGKELMEAVAERADQEIDVEFHVVVPLRRSANLANARSRLEEQLALFDELNMRATGEIGSADPLRAAEVAIARAPTEEVLISTLPAGASRWLSNDLPSRARRNLSVPVVHIEAARPGTHLD